VKRNRNRMVLRIVCIAGVTLLGLSACASGAQKRVTVHGRTTGTSVSTTTTTSGFRCTTDIPPTKCAALQRSSAETGGTPPPPPPDAPPPSPAKVYCGPTFFDSATRQMLANQFGSYSCFRFAQGQQWIVVGTGEYLDSPVPGPAPGGQMLAVEQCSSDLVCLDANANRAFDDRFTVYYPPNPSTPHGGKLETTFGTMLLQFVNSDCGLFIFSLRDLNWHGHSQADLDALSAGQPDRTVPVPPPSPGSTARHSSAPQSTGACQ